MGVSRGREERRRKKEKCERKGEREEGERGRGREREGERERERSGSIVTSLWVPSHKVLRHTEIWLTVAREICLQLQPVTSVHLPSRISLRPVD